MFMRHKKFYSSLVIIISGLAVLPLIAFAQAHITISPNLPGPLNTTPTGSSPGAYIKNFYSYALFLSGLLAFGAIVYGGIKYAIARGNPSGESEAKQWIWSALLGMLLLAGAYIILFTINPNLVNLALPALPTTPTTPVGGGVGGPTGGGGAAGGLSQADAQRELNGAGIAAVSSGNCTDRTNARCTSFDGMKQSTVDALISFKDRCGCAVTVTGGTEVGHSAGVDSHANGYKADIAVNPVDDAYIMNKANGFTPLGPRSSDGAQQYKDPSSGAIFARETHPNHWDITAPGG
jgi:hypothetical protein